MAESKHVKLENVRVAFLSCFEPKRVGNAQDAAMRYSGVAIIEPDSENHKRIMQRIVQQCKAVYGDDWQETYKDLVARDRCAYVQRDYRDQKGNVYEGFEDHFAIRFSNEVQPKVRDRDGSELDKSKGKPYGGAICNVWVDIWAQKNAYGRRINATFGAIQFVNDAPAFGKGAPVSEDEFENLAINDVDQELADANFEQAFDQAAEATADTGVDDDDLSKYL